MAVSAALGRSCHATLLRPAAPQRAFRHSAFRSVSRSTPRKLERRIRSQQTSIAAPPAGLAIPPWTDSTEQIQAGLQLLPIFLCSMLCHGTVMSAPLLLLQALQQLQDKMNACSYGKPDEDTLKWFLRDRKLDVDETVDKLTNMLKWRQDFQ